MKPKRQTYILIKIDSIILVNGFTVQLSQTSLVTSVDSTVLVDCITTPKDDVNVRWEKTGNPIPLKPASGTEPDVFYMPNNTLKITKVKRRHAGQYSCIATYNNEDRLADFTVEIMCKILFLILL